MSNADYTVLPKHLLTYQLKETDSLKVIADLLKKKQGNPNTAEAIYQKFCANFFLTS